MFSDYQFNVSLQPLKYVWWYSVLSYLHQIHKEVGLL